MRCIRCSAEVPANSRFCLQCGAPIAAGTAAPHQATGSYRPQQPVPVQQNIQPSPVFSQPRASSNKWAVPLVILLLALLGAAGFTASRLLQKPASPIQPAPLVQAPASGFSAPLVQAPSAPAAAPLVQQPAAVQQPPDTSAISDYLAFLEQVELTKQKLIGEELGQALSTYGNITPDQIKAASSSAAAKTFLPKINQDSSSIRNQWLQLTQTFENHPHPQACEALFEAYYQHLNTCLGMFQSIHNALKDAQSNPNEALSELSGMLGNSSSSADQSAATADQALGDVCSKYNLTKNFSITTGADTSSLLR